jgi:hypothetical protein
MTRSLRFFRLGVVASLIWVAAFGLFVGLDFLQSRTSFEWLLDSSLCSRTWLTQSALAQCERQRAQEWRRRESQLGWIVLPAALLLALGAAPLLVSRGSWKTSAR